MNTIVEKKQLSADVYLLRVNAPLIARERKPGQFIILQICHNFGERIPLTIADADAEAGTITLIFQRVGATTVKLAACEVGDELQVVGPLGLPTHIENFGHAVVVGGGIGVAPAHPIVQGLREAGNRITVIMGARNKDLLILEDEMRALADEFIICTDDGSAGRKCLVTEPLKELCEQDPKPDVAIAIGPPVMMKFCTLTTKPYEIPTLVSLNSIMIDGTGMCGGCRVTVGNETKFVCVDGPEFDGHQVDFENLIKRLQSFKDQEKFAHNCQLAKAKQSAAEA
jgi:ferredoxin--NADP+ reductase